MRDGRNCFRFHLNQRAAVKIKSFRYFFIFTRPELGVDLCSTKVDQFKIIGFDFMYRYCTLQLKAYGSHRRLQEATESFQKPWKLSEAIESLQKSLKASRSHWKLSKAVESFKKPLKIINPISTGTIPSLRISKRKNTLKTILKRNFHQY